MNDSPTAAAPHRGTHQATHDADGPEEFPDDPEIEALLKFAPAPRKINRGNGWNPALQRKFIAHLARTGSPTKAADALGKDPHGAAKVYKGEGAEGFRAAWDAAMALFQEREAARLEAEHRAATAIEVPGIGRKLSPAARLLAEAGGAAGGPGQVRNERGEWEDEGSLRRRAEDARDSISAKLLSARRLYLKEISDSPGKRAAFEILTELPIDWEAAERLEPQRDEPWRMVSMRQPDMLLTAENGWMGDMAHGPDKKAELRRAIDEHRASEGLPAVAWSEDAEDD